MPPTQTSARQPFGGILSTSLLDDIWTQALDPGYDASSRARGAGSSVQRRPRRGLAVTVVLSLVLAAGAAAAAGQVHRSLTDSRGTKPALVHEVEREQQAATALSAQLDLLRTRTAAIRERQLATTAAGDRLSEQIQAAQDAVAATPVVGPGVTVRISDASGSLPGTGEVGLVTDADLRDVVNALWAAGAEAVAVNGYRLGPSTAIRTAGEAILVDFRPVTSPYVIAVIGPQNALQTGLAASAAGQRLQVLHSAYGVGLAVHAASSLHLAGTTPTDVRYAVPLTEGTRS